jgi:hypothetical protein
LTRPVRHLLLALLATFALAASLGAAVSAAGPPQFQTAIADGDPFNSENMPASLPHVKQTGATAVRLYVSWESFVFPRAATSKPAGMDATNPSDSHYDFSGLDDQVKQLKAVGLEPIISLESAPPWAERSSGWVQGSNTPDAIEYGEFALALARRYSGAFEGLPRVKYWQAWNEPNNYHHLNPQFEDTDPHVDGSAPVPAGAPFKSADIYRSILNAFADSIHSVHPDNLVIAGGLSTPGRPFRESPAVSPLRFMRALLCLNAQNRQLAGCNEQAHFDVWSAHPYTSGSPEHHAARPDDVSIPDLPKMRAALNAANGLGQIVSTNTVQFWVTELSWDSNPPDPGAVPMKLLQRWVSEAFFRMWSYGVSLVTWFQLRDTPPAPGQSFSDSFQSGIYFHCATDIACDKPKPTLESFRFPFVAYTHGKNKVLIWGRTPAGVPGKVNVEPTNGSRFKRLKALRTNSHGIFTTLLRTKGKGDLRATLGGESSISFSLKVPPDRPGNPFG